MLWARPRATKCGLPLSPPVSAGSCILPADTQQSRAVSSDLRGPYLSHATPTKLTRCCTFERVPLLDALFTKFVQRTHILLLFALHSHRLNCFSDHKNMGLTFAAAATHHSTRAASIGLRDYGVRTRINHDLIRRQPQHLGYQVLSRSLAWCDDSVISVQFHVVEPIRR